ncbi:MAG: metal-dependent hydrolase [Polyangiales bacterium]
MSILTKLGSTRPRSAMPPPAAAAYLQPRALDLPKLDDVPQHWMDDDVYLTALFNALSLVFPSGERYFMDSVRALRSHVREPKLLEDVRGFLGQEAMHSRKHADFNDWLSRFGINPAAVMARVDADIAQHKVRRSPLQNLAVTCALEHLTTTMAEAWLTDDALRAQADARIRTLWTWHALEELEHKAVAYDVYLAAGGDYQTRALMMAAITIGFVFGIARLQRHLLQQQGTPLGRRARLRGLIRLWGPRGHFTRMIPQYLGYYAPSFHPSERDHAALCQRFERELRSTGQVRVLSEARHA